MTRRTLLAASLCALLPALAGAVDLPTGGKVDKVDFERHVMGLLSKTGCNSGSCHGSFQGKNGFRLSLFGYEPNSDYAWITKDNLGVTRPKWEQAFTLKEGIEQNKVSRIFLGVHWSFDAEGGEAVGDAVAAKAAAAFK